MGYHNFVSPFATFQFHFLDLSHPVQFIYYHTEGNFGREKISKSYKILFKILKHCALPQTCPLCYPKFVWKVHLFVPVYKLPDLNKHLKQLIKFLSYAKFQKYLNFWSAIELYDQFYQLPFIIQVVQKKAANKQITFVMNQKKKYTYRMPILFWISLMCTRISLLCNYSALDFLTILWYQPF